MKNNRIPRKFDKIIGKMLVDTSVSKTNDIVHVSKDEYGQLVLYNTRTEKRRDRSSVC